MISRRNLRPFTGILLTLLILITPSSAAESPLSPGDPPVAVIDSPREGSIWYADEGVFLSANSSYDPDGGNLTYIWLVNSTLNETLFNERYGWVTLAPGEYLITLRVTDSENLSSEATVNITVYQHRNRPPLPHINSPRDNSTFPKTELIPLNASGTVDEDPSSLLYTWFSNVTGFLGSGVELRVRLPEGRHRITLFADDGEYNVSAAVNITVYNRAPECEIVGPGRVNLGEVAHFTAEATDPDGDPLRYLWNMGDGTQLEGPQVNHTYPTGGYYTVVLVVSDGSSWNSTSTSNHTLFVNTPPVVEEVPDVQAVVGEEVSLTARASDPDGENLTYLWDMDGDGVWDLSGENATYVYTSSGRYTACLNVSDPSAWTLVSFQVVVLPPNSPPVAGAVSPVVVTLRGASASVKLDASPSYDPDDDVNGDGRIEPPEVDNLTYRWDLDPVIDSDGDGIPDNDADLEGKVVSAIFTQPGEHRVILNVTDPRGAWNTTSVTVIVNRPPVAEITGPERAFVGQGLNFSAGDSSDPDQDTLSYLWEFGDGSEAEGVKVSHSYPTRGVFTVTLTVSDGYAEDTASMDVEVFPLPEIKITYPESYSEVSGEIYISGSVDAPPGFQVERVEISIDNSAYVEASPVRGGYRSFTYLWDTREVADGPHRIRVRAYVEGVWAEKEIQVNVKNTSGGGGGAFPGIYAILIAAILIMLVVVGLLRKKRPSPGSFTVPLQKQPPAAPQPPTTPQVKEKREEVTLRVHCPRCGKYFDYRGEPVYPIRLRCPHCGARGVIEKEGAEMGEEEGVAVVCPVCSEVFYVKEQKPLMRCPHCGTRGKIPLEVLEELERIKQEREAKITLRCPRCGEKFELPQGHRGATVCPHCGARGYI